MKLVATLALFTTATALRRPQSLHSKQAALSAAANGAPERPARARTAAPDAVDAVPVTIRQSLLGVTAVRRATTVLDGTSNLQNVTWSP